MTTPAATIYHITTRDAWTTAVATNQYTADSLATEGFIHCSTRAQLTGTANTFFHGRSDLILLQIDAARATAPIVYEDLYAKGEPFPHLYGPLNLDAVTAVIDFPARPDGSFALPDLLREA